MKRILLACLIVAAIVGISTTAQADITGVALGTGAPPATLGSYTMTAFPDDYGTPYTDITSLASPLGGTVDFSSAMEIRTIGPGWATWSHGYTGDVLSTKGATSVTLTLPAMTGAFYFYAEPNPWATYTITATAQDGTFASQDVDGYAGAAGFGFYGDSIATIAITSATDFAIGEFGIAAVPVPGAVLLGVLGLSVAGARLRRRQS